MDSSHRMGRYDLRDRGWSVDERELTGRRRRTTPEASAAMDAKARSGQPECCQKGHPTKDDCESPGVIQAERSFAVKHFDPVLQGE